VTFTCNRFGVREFDFIASVQLAYESLHGGVLDCGQMHLHHGPWRDMCARNDDGL